MLLAGASYPYMNRLINWLIDRLIDFFILTISLSRLIYLLRKEV